MFLKVVTLAIFAGVVAPVAAQAQSLAQIGGPAETPPAGYKGDQFVDSRGCVFLRAGINGQSQWVPRVSRARKVLCGFPPTFGAKPVIEMADESVAPAPRAVVEAAPVVVAEAAPAPVVRTTRAPMKTVASLMMPEAQVAAPVRQPAPYVTAAPVASYEVAATAGPSKGKIGCYSTAPVPQVVRLRSGGTAVVCTRGDGTMAGWRPPIYPNGAGVGASLRDPVGVSHGQHDPARVTSAPQAQTYAAQDETIHVPKGYKLAWQDDRLNPKRGKGTAAGRAAQNQIWTEEVPARLVADVAKAKAKKKRKSGGQVVVSSKGAATEPAQAPRKAAAGGLWVQVGTFGVPANAEGAAQRLSSIGLPVAKSRMSKGGKALEIVLAGPFGSAGDAQAAAAMARRAGFGDAFVR